MINDTTSVYIKASLEKNRNIIKPICFIWASSNTSLFWLSFHTSILLSMCMSILQDRGRSKFLLLVSVKKLTSLLVKSITKCAHPNFLVFILYLTIPRQMCLSCVICKKKISFISKLYSLRKRYLYQNMLHIISENNLYE